jgi:alkyl hydroperoxide reductase subunit AhpC
MLELGELEKNHSEFARRNVRVIVISNDDLETAGKTQADFPNLIVISDGEQNLAGGMQVMHPGMGPSASDTNAPTTFLVDGSAYVRWMYRPDRFLERLPPGELVAAVDEIWPRR